METPNLTFMEQPSSRIPKSELEITFVSASGPGGQNVNKRKTKPQIHWSINSSKVFSDEEKAVLRSKLNTDDMVTVSAQQERSQGQNLKIALEKFYSLIDAAFVVEAERVPTEPTASSQHRRLDEKKRLGAKKSGRQRRFEE